MDWKIDVAKTVTREFVIGWGDCAPSGAVYYPNYFRWFDQAMWQLFAANDAPIPELEKSFHIVGVPLKDLSCEFLLPCRLHDNVKLESRFLAVGEKDIDIVHELTRDGTLLVRGTDHRFWGVRSSETGKLRRQAIPEDVARKIRPA